MIDRRALQAVLGSGLARAGFATLALAIVAYGAWYGMRAWDLSVTYGRPGLDLELYLETTRRWLAGGTFYPAHQLAGPYLIAHGDILYPPTTILLFLPWLVLPTWTFVAVPAAIIAVVVWHHRPAPWTWPLLALGVMSADTIVRIVHANPFIWAAAATALGTVWGWPSVFVLIKPSLFPFALVGIRRRSWWIALAACLATALIFLPMWPDYLRVLANGRNPNGLLYNLTDAALLSVPVIAWLGRRREASPPHLTGRQFAGGTRSSSAIGP